MPPLYHKVFIGINKSISLKRATTGIPKSAAKRLIPLGLNEFRGA
jgi:hypothetical protein